jgi:hypothetical protein
MEFLALAKEVAQDSNGALVARLTDSSLAGGIVYPQISEIPGPGEI